MSNPSIPPGEYNLRTLLDEEGRRLSFSINCVNVGRIVDYDDEAQTAQVQLAVKKRMNGEEVAPTVLKDCPVVIMGGGHSRLTMPIMKDDPCLVLFNDRDLDNWHYAGGQAAPNTDRAHSLSDGIVIVGLRPRTDAYSDMNHKDAEINSPGISLKGNVKVSTGATGTFSSNDGKVITVVNGIIVNIL